MAKSKKILVVAYYWPPYGGGGVQRNLKFVKYLARLGWNITVITPKKIPVQIVDNSLGKEVPGAVKVIRVLNLEYRNLKFVKKAWNNSKNTLASSGGEKKQNQFGKTLRAIINFARILHIPDETVYWRPLLSSRVYSNIRERPPDVVYTSAPPYSMLVTCSLWSKLTKIPLVVDFRDAWSNIPAEHHSFKMPGWRKKIDLLLEKGVLSAASQITVVSQPMKNYFVKRGVDKSKITVIPNGFDPEDFIGVRRKKTTKFQIIYAGTLYDKTHLELFVESVKKFVKKTKLNNVRLSILGEDTVGIREISKSSDLNFELVYKGYQPHKKVLEELSKSDVALLIVSKQKGNEAVLTGKVYEYIRSGTPILAVVPKKSPIKKLLDETGAGIYTDLFDGGVVAKMISRIYRGKQLPVRNKKVTAKYSRKNQTKELQKVLQKAINNA